MNNNQPPFVVGQKVIALNDSIFHPEMKKGNEYVVLGLKYCCRWMVDVGFKVKLSASECSCCKKIISPHGGIAWKGATRFAPLPPAYENISSELAQKGMNVGDGVDVPVKVLETVNN
jgi:hypothetical protein